MVEFVPFVKDINWSLTFLHRHVERLNYTLAELLFSCQTGRVVAVKNTNSSIFLYI